MKKILLVSLLSTCWFGETTYGMMNQDCVEFTELESISMAFLDASDEEEGRINVRFVGSEDWKTITLEHLIDARNIEEISLCNNNLLAKLMFIVIRQKEIKKLYLSGSSVTDNNVNQLKKTLKLNSSLKALQIDTTGAELPYCLTNRGFKHLKEGVLASPSLESCEFILPEIDSSTFHADYEIMKDACLKRKEAIEVVHVGDDVWTRMSFKRLKEDPKVSQIRIYNDRKVTELVLDDLRQRGEVKALWLLGSSLTDGNVKTLRRMLGENDGLKVLIVLPANEMIPQISDAGFRELVEGVLSANSLTNFSFQLPLVNEQLCRSEFKKMERACFNREKGIEVSRAGENALTKTSLQQRGVAESSSLVHSRMDSEIEDENFRPPCKRVNLSGLTRRPDVISVKTANSDYHFVSLPELMKMDIIENVKIVNDHQMTSAVLDVLKGQKVVKHLELLGSSINSKNLKQLREVLRNNLGIPQLTIKPEGCIMPSVTEENFSDLYGAVMESPGLMYCNIMLRSDLVARFSREFADMIAICQARRNAVNATICVGADAVK